MKRGQGLSLTVIIVAAIALIVLVVLVAIFSGRMGGWIKGVESCADKTDLSADKRCSDTPECPDGYAALLGTDCGKDSYCCIKI